MPCVGVRVVARSRTGLVQRTKATRQDGASPAQEAVRPADSVAQGSVPPAVL